MCLFNNESYVRKIKTWRKNDIKYKENYYLNKKGTWLFCLGLNPSQTFNELVDSTNLKLCNYFISNLVNEKKVKGYTLLNFSNVAKTKSADLDADDFDKNHMRYINYALKLILKKKFNEVIFFYGRDKKNRKLINEITNDDFRSTVLKLIENEQLYITINTRELNENGEPNTDFNLFTHPGHSGMGNYLGIRLATKEDLEDLF